MAVAQDSGGWEAAGPYVDKAKASYTALIDKQHLVTALYGLTNVPSALWIDERGIIVRPPEIAWTKHYDFGGLVEVDGAPYVAALRDWVRKGSASEHALEPEQVRARIQAASHPDRGRADAHFQLAVRLRLNGDLEAAARHFEAAQELDINNWNYHRQEWFYAAPEDRAAKWRAKYDALNGRPYYEPPAFRGPHR